MPKVPGWGRRSFQPHPVDFRPVTSAGLNSDFLAYARCADPPSTRLESGLTAGNAVRPPASGCSLIHGGITPPELMACNLVRALGCGYRPGGGARCTIEMACSASPERTDAPGDNQPRCATRTRHTLAGRARPKAVWFITVDIRLPAGPALRRDRTSRQHGRPTRHPGSGRGLRHHRDVSPMT
jgi:hypothetical protein